MHVSRRPVSTPPLSSNMLNSTPPPALSPSLSPTLSPTLSPYNTPTKRNSNRYSDRFIPSRLGSGDLQTAFELLRHSAPPSPSSENASANPKEPSSSSNPYRSSAPSCYSLLLKSELLGSPPPQPSLQSNLNALPAHSAPPARPKRPSSLRHASPVHPGLHGLHAVKRLSASPTVSSTPADASPLPSAGNIFRFKSPPPRMANPLSALDAASAPFGLRSSDAKNALLSASMSPGRSSRKIARSPFKVLDAPCLQDDFYLNLVDWSSANVLAVGLGSCVYLWSACTSAVTKLCDLQFGGPVCSVAWSQQGTELAIGTMPGKVQIWDTATGKLIRVMSGHTARAGCLAWNANMLSSGGRDKEIFNRDIRSDEQYVAQLSGHKQEVCGLRWSPDDMQLASGGNDNKLLIWNASSGLGSGGNHVSTGSGVQYNRPVLRFSYHDAAVKAIAWSPHARGLLASGGGTADRKIRFCNTMTNSALAAVDTGSQVCNLAWSKNVNEIVSTHGYSQNQIIVWKYPTLSKVVTLTGHSYRVLYLAVSPSGETIVTGAGDETLRFWNVFPSAKNHRGSCDSSSVLSPNRMSIR